MRFSLQDVKKRVQRRGGELSVSLHFLHAGELHAEIERLVAYHEQLVGQPQRHFSIDEARACIGDYRLAHCLVATLSAWYSRRQPDWKEALQRIGSDLPARFEEAGITSPVHLRLALYDYVNERYSGFLGEQTRSEALQKFAATYGGEPGAKGPHDSPQKEQHSEPGVPELEYLLALDSDDEALLVRDAPHPPGAAEVAALYNQWVFEAALFNASDVHFVIDCHAFMQVQRAGNDVNTTGIGAIIKRLCYFARKLGVYYDLAYDAGSTTLDAAPSILHLTLYGPQEMTGAPQQYGLRLATLCRLLLGYSSQVRPRRGGVESGGDPPGRPWPGSSNSGNITKKSTSITLPSTAILEAEATVHFLQRSYCFVMDANLLKLLPPPADSVGARFIAPSSAPSSPEHVPGQQLRESARPYQVAPSIFDSSIEQSFAGAFRSLANSHGTDGWRLEREPEPLLLGATPGETASTLQGIFIPDFALTRGNRRIYVEILGFWTPSYRERKVAKLRHLKGRSDLLLAIPVEARPAYASIAPDFPIVEYHGQLSVAELLHVLRTHYDDLAERLAQVDVDGVRKRIEREGLLLEQTCYELLHCYRRSELARAAERIVNEDCAFTPGIGLYQVNWLERLRSSFVEWIEDSLREEGGRDRQDGVGDAWPLPRVFAGMRTRWPSLAGCEDATLEALISLWPEVHISRSSIFEPVVELVGKEGVSFEKKATPASEVVSASKKSTRERRASPKKHSGNATTQGDLWG